MSSTLIPKQQLVPASQTLNRYPKLQIESKVSALAVKLARESFFGVKILSQCTVMGIGKYPGLPTEEINQLKQTIFSLFPRYWSSPIEYEILWRDCADAVGQACKRIRIDAQKQNPVVIE